MQSSRITVTQVEYGETSQEALHAAILQTFTHYLHHHALHSEQVEHGAPLSQDKPLEGNEE